MISCTTSDQALLCMWEQRQAIYDESKINSCFDGVLESDDSNDIKVALKAIFLDADNLTKTQWKIALGFQCLIGKFDRLEAEKSGMKEGFDAIETCFASSKENPTFSNLISTIYVAFIEKPYFNKSQNSDSQ